MLEGGFCQGGVVTLLLQQGQQEARLLKLLSPHPNLKRSVNYSPGWGKRAMGMGRTCQQRAERLDAMVSRLKVSSTRQVLSMIPSARSAVSPVVIIKFTPDLEKWGRKDGRTDGWTDRWIEVGTDDMCENSDHY